MKKNKILFLSAAIVMEIAAVILIGKAISSNSSPTMGIAFLVIGLAILIIGIASKSTEDNKNPK